jgi:hypothetical protein
LFKSIRGFSSAHSNQALLCNKACINLLSGIALHSAVGIAHKEDTEIAFVNFEPGIDVIATHMNLGFGKKAKQTLFID